MAGPSVAWDPFTLDEVLPHGPPSAALFTKLRNNQEHLKEVADGGSGYTGGTGHAHDGTDSAAVDVTVQENLILNGCPANSRIANLWTYNGFRPAQNFQDGRGSLYGGTSTSDYIWQIVGAEGSGESTGMVGTASGDGMDCVVSFFIRPLLGIAVAGALSFGFADGSTSTFTQSAGLTYSDVISQWTRVYARFDAAGAGHSTDNRFLLKITSPYTFGLLVTGFQVNRGRHLAPWTISTMEGQKANHGNVAYTGMPQCPLLDQRVAMDDAVDLTP